MKLSVQVSENIECNVLHISNGLIAISNQENVVRLFDTIENDNYVLSLEHPKHMAAPNDTINRISYVSKEKVLYGITEKNRIVLWRFKGLTGEDASDQDWDILSPINVSFSFDIIDGGCSSHYNKDETTIAVFNQSQQKICIFCETLLQQLVTQHFTALQFAPNRLAIVVNDDKVYTNVLFFFSI